MKRKFINKRFNSATLATIDHANDIIAEYQADGYTLTLRQLYYQFVSRDLIANEQSEYKRLGSIVSDARLAGAVDWDAIEDRTRNLQRLAHWGSPKDILEAVARQYRQDRWAGQPTRVEVWIEKEALAGVFERVCNEFDVAFFCCRGYPSISEMHAAARRIEDVNDEDYAVTTILHFGDHDPSGVDMTRDIADRLSLLGCDSDEYTGIVNIKRVALNMDQVRKYDPPPNPAKAADARYKDYELLYGNQCWELDALEPQVLAQLCRDNITQLIQDDDAWAKVAAEIEGHKKRLKELAKNFD